MDSPFLVDVFPVDAPSIKGGFPLGKIGKNVLFPENSGSLKTTHDIEDTPSLAPKAKSITINPQQ